MDALSSLLLFIALAAIAAVLAFANAKNYRRISNRVKTSVGECVIDISTAQAAQRLINGALPHDETDLQRADKVWFFLRGSYQYEAQSSEYTVDMEVFPKASNIKEVVLYFLIGMFGPYATLQVKCGQKTQNTVYLKYFWTGEENALHAAHSVEYTIMTHLINQIEREFTSKGYSRTHKTTGSHLKQSHAESIDEAQVLANKQARAALQKQWWRSYVASVHGLRDYPFWPNPQDYSESVQASAINFMDEELRNSGVAMNALGIPKVASGMFASVYQFSNAHQHWAVRCFNTKLVDQHERYKAISKFILADDLPYTVDFNYLEDGIKVNAVWFPILKMNWVDGITLDSYVERNVKETHALEHLRSEFRLMMERMHKNDIAHGDLQHGNIMISNDEIYLVDYDAFYVPELQGRFSNEIGHPNYNHPQRKDKHYGPYMDNFPAHVIDISLQILVEDATAWSRFKGGDECLLFRRKDFLDPTKSELMNFLKSHKSTALQDAYHRLSAYLRLEPEDVPFLAEPDKAVSIQISKLQES